ncbi:putative NAD/FAD transporter SLC25A32 [Helianthus annuus]|nr:putative NAD/FAD transporter SLC25A32 [Helianthus annuus]
MPDSYHPICMLQGVYYYFYQIFRSKAEAAALKLKKEGSGDGSVGMLSSLMVAAMSGYFLRTIIKFVICVAWSVRNL